MRIYLDNQTTARPSQAALNALVSSLENHWGTPAVPHQMGFELLPSLKEAYEALYTLVQAPTESHFVFTSSGAEAINHVVWTTYLDITRKLGKNHFVTSSIDEAPTIMSMERLQEWGCSFDMAAATTKGTVTAQSIADAITPRTALVSISWVNALTGVIQPVEEIAALCKERGILFHVDATHALGKGYFPWSHCKADFLTFNGDQIHAPKGCGGLFIREGLEISPFIIGGNEQNGVRGGSFNLPALIGFGAAAKEAYENRDSFCLEVGKLRNLLEKELLSLLPKCTILFEEEERVPHLSCINFPGVTSDALLFMLSRQNLFASLGGGTHQKIHLLLKACGIHTHSALSFCLSKDTTRVEIEEALQRLKATFLKLKKNAQFIEGLA